MSFAYWRKCDFQIHTPRDANWVGTRPIGIGEDNGDRPATEHDVEAARATWAINFVNQCATKGLGAVALTDHHEMIMVPYVQEAIQQREAADPNFSLWLFPGMELTCAGGVQALILFDSDLSEDWRVQVQHSLGIVTANLDGKASRSPPRVTQLSWNYADISATIDALGDGLIGKYIVLPNVSQGGRHTVLTDGAYADFRRMPYVGGYVDNGQNINTLGTKNKKRLSGAYEKWSTRFVYPLPTSDCRTADYATLGSNNCWIKLAHPTAEAIRQAFLGHQSRISISRPTTASLTISKLQLSGSTILSDATFNLSPELNSFIGGRGSGKSSILEYIAFGLGRSCSDLEKPNYSGSDRMSSLIKDTLISKGGSLILTLNQDGASFEISRTPGNGYQPQVTYPNGTVQPLGLRELRSLFPAVVYSQGELSELGKKAESRTQLTDLLQFVNQDYKREDDQLTSSIKSAREIVRTAAQKLVATWRLQADLLKLQTKKGSLDQRIQALQKTLPTLSEEDQNVVNQFELLSEFEGSRAQASLRSDRIMTQIEELWKGESSPVQLSSLAPEASNFIVKYTEFDQTFKEGLTSLGKATDEKRVQLDAAAQEWTVTLEKARAARDAVMEKLGEHKTVTGQIAALQKEAETATLQIASLKLKMTSPDEAAKTLVEAVTTLKLTVRARGDRTSAWAQEIEQLSNQRIKATLHIEGDTSEIREALDIVSAKTGSQEAHRQRAIEEAISSSSAWQFLDAVRTECQNILHYQQIGSSQNGEKPECEKLFNAIGSTERTKDACVELLDLTRFEAIATATPKPDITLTYCDGERSISFEKASEGQRAAALLFMLLQQAGGPLLVDQPEGDLDNSVIADLTDLLHDAKHKRQIIFASHNANVVVNGSSELVSHLDVQSDGMRFPSCSGAIDVPDICRTITQTMEGGEKAFRDRQVKYGY